MLNNQGRPQAHRTFARIKQNEAEYAQSELYKL